VERLRRVREQLGIEEEEDEIESSDPWMNIDLSGFGFGAWGGEEPY